MRCRGSLVRLGHYYLVYHRSITCSWLCYAACDATWSEGEAWILLSSRCELYAVVEWDGCIEWPSCSWWWSWSEWVGISGGHSPHVQKKKTLHVLLVGSFTSSLNWLCFSFCFCTKEDPISIACLTPQLVNCHGSMASFSDLHLTSSLMPGPARPGHITSPKGPTRVIL